MSDFVQYLLAGIIVLAALFVLARAVVRALRHQHTELTACVGCKLHDVCTRSEKNSAKKCADKVAQVKK